MAHGGDTIQGVEGVLASLLSFVLGREAIRDSLLATQQLGPDIEVAAPVFHKAVRTGDVTAQVRARSQRLLPRGVVGCVPTRPV